MDRDMGSEPKNKQQLEKILKDIIITAYSNDVDMEGYYKIESKEGNPIWELELYRIKIK